MCVLLEFLQKTWAIPIMNPLSWFMIELMLALQNHQKLAGYALGCISARTDLGFLEGGFQWNEDSDVGVWECSPQMLTRF